MVGWRALDEELDAWATAGREANFWWRDDDAATTTAALARLIDLTGEASVPVCLAVIPAAAEAALAPRIGAASEGLVVVPHGYAHRNHAPPGQKKAEFPAGRDLGAMIEELKLAWSLTSEPFGTRALPVLVPPWNLISPDLIARLPEAGYRALSAIAPMDSVPPPVPGVTRRDTHVDIIDWRGSRAFIGEAAALDAIVTRLAAFRGGSRASVAPLGILTHHLVHDAPAWAFLARFAARTLDHHSVRWPSVAKIFTL